MALHEVRVPQGPEHRCHHEVAGGEAVFQECAVAEPGGEVRQPCPRRPLQVGPAVPRPGLVGMEEVELDELLDHDLDRVESRDEPGRRPRPPNLVPGEERLAAGPDMKHDRARLEENEAVLLEDRHLPERLCARYSAEF